MLFVCYQLFVCCLFCFVLVLFLYLYLYCFVFFKGALHGRATAFALLPSSGDSIALSERDEEKKPLYAHNVKEFVLAAESGAVALRWTNDINNQVEVNSILVPTHLHAPPAKDADK